MTMAEESSKAQAASSEGGEPPANRDPATQPRVSMLFAASNWTFNVRLGRSGREEGEGVIIVGEVSYRTGPGDRRVHPARAMVVKSDARKRLELVLSPQETVITIPLEPFAMQRLQDRLKDLVSRYGMTLRVAFSAMDTAERQPLDAVDFAFSAGSKTNSFAPPQRSA
jgi:hypothetical protein